MKAVLVIDMPEHCYECPVVNYKHCNANYFVRRNHGGNIPYNFSNEYIHEQGRQTWCPLKPLTDKHGRLIDADAFIERMKDASKRQKYKEVLIGDCLTVDDVFKAIIESLQNEGLANGDAPTIIEADEGETE